MENPAQATAQTDAQTIPVHHSALAPLREPLFRSLWIAAVISYTGSWMQNVATGWLMSSLTNSAIWVSLVQVALSLPVFLIALPAGALADIIDRRKFLLFTQVSMVAAAGYAWHSDYDGSDTTTIAIGVYLLAGCRRGHERSGLASAYA
jgi:MFS family permease